MDPRLTKTAAEMTDEEFEAAMATREQTADADQRKRQTMELVKSAAMYRFRGDVQGVGLRKTLHSILDEHKEPGLAYNEAHSGDVYADLPLPSARRNEILARIKQHVEARPGRTFHAERQWLRPWLPSEWKQPVDMSPADVQAAFQRQGFQYHNQSLPWLAERFRLKQENGRLTGRVPGLAARQLKGEAPMYRAQTKAASFGLGMFAAKHLANWAARLPGTPFRRFYENASREGMRTGFNQTGQTILPGWRLPVHAVTGPMTGVTDYETGRALGGAARQGYDKFVAKNPAVRVHSQAAPDFDRFLATARNYAAAAQGQPAIPGAQPLPMSRNNVRRLYKSLPQEHRTLLQAAVAEGQSPQQYRSPIVRHAVGALNEPSPSPAFNWVRDRFTSAEPQRGQLGRVLGTSGALSAVGALGDTLVNGPVSAGLNLAGDLTTGAIPDALMANRAAQGRYQAIGALKARMLNTGVKAQEQTGWRGALANAKAYAASAVSPDAREFISAGRDLSGMDQRMRQRTTGDPAAAAQYAQQSATVRAGLQQHGSLPHLWQGLKSDFSPTPSPAVPTAPIPKVAMEMAKRAYMNPAHAQGLMQLAAQPFLRHWMSQHGLFYSSGNRNLYDQQRDFRQRGEHWDAMAEAAKADQPTYERLIGGIANIAGARPAPGTRAHDLIRRAAGDVSKIAPYAMTFAPELWDRLHGSRGSAAALASKVYLAHRGTPDPVTNQMGYSPHTSAEMATGVYNQLYGPKAPPNAAAGYSAGEIGDLYQSMVHRGLMGSKRPPNPLDAAGSLKAMAGPMATLRGMSSSLQAQHALPGTVKTGADEEEQTSGVAGPSIAGTAGVVGGLAAAHLGSPLVTGLQRVYHGTSNQAASAIRREGLRPDLGGSQHGSTFGVGGLSGAGDEMERIRGKVFVATTPAGRLMARFHGLLAEQNQRGRRFYEGMPDAEFLGNVKHIARGLVNPLDAGRGTVLVGHTPYQDFRSRFEHDPKWGPLPAHQSTQPVSPETFRPFSGLRNVPWSRLPSYVGSHPVRFGVGAGATAAGLAAAAYGGSSLIKALQRIGRRSTGRKSGEEPTALASLPVRPPIKTGAATTEEKATRRKAPRRNYTAGAAYGLGGAALIGGAGLYGKHHLDRMPPSLLQLGEGLWKDPLKLDEFRRRWETAKGRGTFQSLQKSLSAGRDSLRQALLDDAPVGKGLSVRDLTFGAGQAKPGDVTLESTWEGSMGRLYNLATGHGYSHVGVVGGPKGQLVHQFGLGPAAQVLETAKARLRPANAFVRLRDQQTGSAPGDAATAAKLEQIYKTETPYNLRGAAGATVHEILPEADWLGKAFNPKTWQGLIKRVLPTSWVQSMGRRAAALRLTGEICSSMASKAKEAIRPGSAPGPDASPGDWLRHTGPGKPHRVDEVYVPEPMRNRQSLLNQHWDRLGPLVPRAALAAAAVGLGGYGLYKGFRHFFPKREKTKKRDEEKTASLAGTGYRGVGTVKTGATALRSRISVVPHPEGQGFQFLLSGKPLGVVRGTTEPGGFRIQKTDSLPQQFKGMGLGKKIYGDMARLAPQQTLYSDSQVSPAAQRVWEGMPRRGGYNYQMNPSNLSTSGSGNRLGVGGQPVYQASLPAAAAVAGPVKPTFWQNLVNAFKGRPAPAVQPIKMATLIGTGYRSDQKTTVCPRCGDELQAKDIYTDKKNWSWCRRCFRQGAGRLHFKAGVAPPVPVRQRTNFDCGSAVVASLLGGLKPKDQDRLADELDTTPNDGAPPIRLVNTMRAAGLQVEEHHLMTLQALRRFIDRGRPVICPIQAWGDEANRHDGVAGHYVVVCGYDEKRQLLHFMDPAIGDFRSLSYPEFWTRWRDHAANGDHYLRYGVVAWNPRKLALPQPGGVQPGEFHKTSFAGATGGSGPEAGQTQVTDPGPWQPGIEPVEEVDDKLVDESMAPPGEDFVEDPTMSPVTGLT